MKIKILDAEDKLVSTLKIPDEEIDHYLDTHFKGTIFDTAPARAIVKALELEARANEGKEKECGKVLNTPHPAIYISEG